MLFQIRFCQNKKGSQTDRRSQACSCNGKAVNIPSYLVKAGDTIEIKEKNKSSQRYKDVLDATAGRVVPEWLEADSENLKGAVKNLPTREVIDVPVDEMLIVELYSK